MSIPVKRMRKFINKIYRLKDWNDSDILALKMDKDELADFFDVTLSTVEYHLRKRGLKVQAKVDINKEYLYRNIVYLYFRQLMSMSAIMKSLNVGHRIVELALKDARKKGIKPIDIEKCNALTIDNDVIRNFDSYRDAANVFPKKSGYSREVY